MSSFDPQIMTLFSWEIFRRMANNQSVTLFQFNSVTQLLVENNIPFDVSFTPATRKLAAALQLTVHVNPTATMVFVTQLSPGASAFTPSP